jgi:hypothetical protein
VFKDLAFNPVVLAYESLASWPKHARYVIVASCRPSWHAWAGRPVIFSGSVPIASGQIGHWDSMMECRPRGGDISAEDGGYPDVHRPSQPVD